MVLLDVKFYFTSLAGAELSFILRTPCTTVVFIFYKIFPSLMSKCNCKTTLQQCHSSVTNTT